MKIDHDIYFVVDYAIVEATLLFVVGICMLFRVSRGGFHKGSPNLGLVLGNAKR